MSLSLYFSLVFPFNLEIVEAYRRGENGCARFALFSVPCKFRNSSTVVLDGALISTKELLFDSIRGGGLGRRGLSVEEKLTCNLGWLFPLFSFFLFIEKFSELKYRDITANRIPHDLNFSQLCTTFDKFSLLIR